MAPDRLTDRQTDMQMR